jgi:hypothetical protein
VKKLSDCRGAVVSRAPEDASNSQRKVRPCRMAHLSGNSVTQSGETVR